MLGFIVYIIRKEKTTAKAIILHYKSMGAAYILVTLFWAKVQ